MGSLLVASSATKRRLALESALHVVSDYYSASFLVIIVVLDVEEIDRTQQQNTRRTLN
jgi:hypothetical protein